MDEYEEEPRSPFWLQSTKTKLTSSIFFNSFFLIILLILFALISIIFIIPYLIQLSSNIFKPSLLKRSWDSINLILVFIALLFGFLTRNITNNEDEKLDLHNHQIEPQISTGAPIIMYDQSSTGLRRQRTSVSYPDLRELSPPSNNYSDDPWKFSDDTHFNYYHVLESNRSSFRQQPSNPVKQKTKRVYRNVAIDDGERSSVLSPETVSSEKNGGKIIKRRARSSEPKRLLSTVLVPVLDSLSPSSVSPASDRKRNDEDAKKDFFTSFYHKKKKKRQRDRSFDNLGVLNHSQTTPENFSITLPPSSPPPPPHPPPPLATTARGANYVPRAAITRLAPFVTDKPGGSFKTTGFNGIDDSSSGGESPMKQRIPPPPPLPPFKMPDWKFAVEGEYVRLQSSLSSRSVSPDADEARSPLSDVDISMTSMELFCPSPDDVDTKADSFIARFRAGLKLSKLGPGPGSGPTHSCSLHGKV